MDRKQVLYITYDGLTDPLGQSQILPYLCGLTAYGYRFTILSFEKNDAFRANEGKIREIIDKHEMTWVPLSFTSKPPIVSKFYDAIRMRSTAKKLHRQNKFSLVHCRSYPASEIGLLLKRKFGVPFLFDMRGFWADEKRDGGAWPDSHPIFKRVYRHYKQKEKEFVSEASHIISLTENGKSELCTWPAYNTLVPVTVIPCCADTTHFTLKQSAERSAGRRIVGVDDSSLLLSYLGSVGSWYMLDEMLQLFVVVKGRYPEAKFLFISHSDPKLITSKASALGLTTDDIIVRKASRQEVPLLAKASDIHVSFIRPDYSKKSSSPTKLGEVLSMGIPVIVNSGVGDVDAIVRDVGAGVVLADTSQQEYERATLAIPDLLKIDAASIREKAKKWYDLEMGVQKYLTVYRQITGVN